MVVPHLSTRRTRRPQTKLSPESLFEYPRDPSKHPWGVYVPSHANLPIHHHHPYALTFSHTTPSPDPPPAPRQQFNFFISPSHTKAMNTKVSTDPANNFTRRQQISTDSRYLNRTVPSHMHTPASGREVLPLRCFAFSQFLQPMTPSVT